MVCKPANIHSMGKTRGFWQVTSPWSHSLVARMMECTFAWSFLDYLSQKFPANLHLSQRRETLSHWGFHLTQTNAMLPCKQKMPAAVTNAAQRLRITTPLVILTWSKCNSRRICMSSDLKNEKKKKKKRNGCITPAKQGKVPFDSPFG